MHPMFVALFIDTDADDLLAEEDGQRRRARRAGRRQATRVIRPAS
jgi:hypothetical protein